MKNSYFSLQKRFNLPSFLPSFIFLVSFLLSNFVQSKPCVVLIHGLMRTNLSLTPLQKYLQSNGYNVVNTNYPSSKKSIYDIAEQDIPLMINQCLKQKPEHIYFVTHSLGGIVLRQYLQTHKLPKETRIVMMAPPNHGSPWADAFHDTFLFKMTVGSAGQALTTNATALKQLDLALPYQVGIIAGNVSLPFMRAFFKGPNDGKVSVASTQLDNMQDFIVLPANHTFIMVNSKVKKQVLSFLDSGVFDH